MTKKHFIAVAKSLRAYRETVDYNDLEFRNLVCELMHQFTMLNPNFNASRFISAIYD